MSHLKIEIAIYLDGKEYALRMWPAVPRVGDEVMLRRMEGQLIADERAVAVVKEICWGTSSESRESPWANLRVSLFCEWCT